MVTKMGHEHHTTTGLILQILVHIWQIGVFLPGGPDPVFAVE